MPPRFVAPPSRPPLPSPRPPSSTTLEPPPLHPSRSSRSIASNPSGNPGALNSTEALLSPSPIPPSISVVPPPTEEQTGSNVKHLESLPATSISDIDYDENDLQDETSLSNNELTDEELRAIFEHDEVDRFIKLFATHVNEVALPPTPTTPATPADGSAAKGWTNVKQPNPTDAEKAPSVPFSQRTPSEGFDLAASIAAIIGPALLSLPARSTSPFTLSSFRTSLERLYLVAYPTYIPFFQSLWALSTWRDSRRSGIYCALYVFLWWYNWLLPALLLKILHSLFRRRFLPYPTAWELRQKRKRMREAEELGNAMTDATSMSFAGFVSLTASDQPDGGNVFGHVMRAVAGEMTVGDAWRTMRAISKGKKQKVRQKAAENLADVLAAKQADGENVAAEETSTPLASPISETPEVNPPAKELSKLEKEALKRAKRELKAKKAEEDWRRGVLAVITEIVDLHERVKNIFLWRRPASSWKYGSVFFVLFIVLATFPAQLLAKLVYLVLGLFFWLVVPVLRALTPEERARLPPALDDVPTDVDYALEYIAQRVARGERVIPVKAKRKEQRRNMSSTDISATLSPNAPLLGSSSLASTSSVNLLQEDTALETSTSRGPPTLTRNLSENETSDASTSKSRKWMGMLNKTVALSDHVFGGGDASIDQPHGMHSALLRLTTPSPAPTPILPNSGPSTTASTSPSSTIQTFPAQLGNLTPGLITLTPTLLIFTPVARPSDPLQIELDRIRGVKKVGMFGGLSIRYDPESGGVAGTSAGDTEPKEVKFGFVGGRDELFTLLIGWGRQRWARV